MLIKRMNTDDPLAVVGSAPAPPDPALLEAIRLSMFSLTIPAQELSEALVGEIFDRAFAQVIDRCFDRLAVPYAVTWAAKQMTNALFSAFTGPDTGSTLATSWHADPVPVRMPMDNMARGTLHIIKKPPPPRQPTPSEELASTVSKERSTRRMPSKGNLRSVNSSAALGETRGSLSQTVSSVRSSPSRTHPGIRVSRPHGSSASTSPARSLHSSDATPPRARTPQADASLAGSGATEAANAIEAEDLEDQKAFAAVLAAKAHERERALRVERQLEAILKQQDDMERQAAAEGQHVKGGNKPSTKPGASIKGCGFVVDINTGLVVLVKPLDSTAKKNQLDVVVKINNGSGSVQSPRGGPGAHGGLSQATTTKKSPRSMRRKLVPQDFCREENGQQLVCSIAKPALGVAVREGDKSEESKAANDAYGVGRVSRQEFASIARSSRGLQSSEGFREYFQNGTFTPNLPDVVVPEEEGLTPPSPPTASPASASATSNLWKDLLASATPLPDPLERNEDEVESAPLHQQLQRLVATTVTQSSSSARYSLAPQARDGPGRHTHHLESIAPRGAPSSTHRHQQAVAVLPLRRPDLLPPLLENHSAGRTSPPPPAAADSGGSQVHHLASTQQEFVLVQKEKDAPHFKGGKAGGASSSHNAMRKEALEILSKHTEVLKARRPTRVVLPKRRDEED